MQHLTDTSRLPQTDLPWEHPHLQALEAYWQGLRTDGDVPERVNLDPAKIQPVLPSTFILQRVAVGTARFRMAGQSIRDLMRIDPRGMPFSTLFEGDDHDELRHRLESAFSDPAIVGLPLTSSGSLTRPAIDGAVLLLPLRDRRGDTTRMLGALVAPHTASQKPRRFNIRTDLRSRHDRMGYVDPRLARLFIQDSPKTKKPDVAKRPALRLVVNNG